MANIITSAKKTVSLFLIYIGLMSDCELMEYQHFGSHYIPVKKTTKQKQNQLQLIKLSLKHFYGLYGLSPVCIFV